MKKLYSLENIETPRIIFKRPVLVYAKQWLQFFKDPTTHLHWTKDEGTPEEQCQRWYLRQEERQKNDEGVMNALIEKHSGNLIGHAGLLIQNVNGSKELEIAYSLLPQFWNKGYAIEAAAECRDQAFLHDFSDSLISIISVTNLPSQNVARKNGMKPKEETIYKNNSVIIFGISKDEWASALSSHGI